MDDQVTEDPQAILDRLEQQSVRRETPCGDGSMVWHVWDTSGGDGAGAGAVPWRCRVVAALGAQHPGAVAALSPVGARPAGPRRIGASRRIRDTAEAIAEIVAAGIDAVLGH